jgi:Flp pilus assembly protein TadD
LAAGVAFALVIGGASTLRSGLAQRYLSSAQSELATSPGAAIRDATRSLRLDGANLDAYYVKAAGQARFGRAVVAHATLLAAARTDPQDYVTWTLLGDLQVRRGDLAGARVDYSRAHALNPNDPTLATLATHPASAPTAGAGG